MSDFWREEFKKYKENIIEEMKTEISQGSISLPDSSIHGDFGNMEPLVSGHINSIRSILLSAVDWKEDWDIESDYLKSRVIRDTLLTKDFPDEITEKDFKDAFHKIRHEYRNKPKKQFRVVFPLWNKPPFLNGVKKIGSINFNFSPSVKTGHNRKITRERNQQQMESGFKTHFTESKITDLKNCSLCFALVKSSFPEDAFERTSEALYEILGLVNIVVDNRVSRSSTNSTEGRFPVSSVLIGPHITIHNKNGLLDYNGFWSENWSKGPSMPNVDFGKWEIQYSNLANRMKKSPWSKECKLAAKKYYKAFANPNLEESFLEGWRLFEMIAGPEFEKINNKIERVSNIYHDPKSHIYLGKHLQLRRNRITHGQPIEADDHETLAFQMAHFIKGFLVRYIQNAHALKLKSEEEFWGLLDLPIPRKERLKKVEEIRRKLFLYKKAALFRRD